MQISKEDLAIVKNILQQIVPNIEVRAFGSRVHGQHLKKFSDIDLALRAKNDEKIKSDIMAKLRNEFEESNLSIRIDIVDLNNINADFAKIINQNYEIIQK